MSTNNGSNHTPNFILGFFTSTGIGAEYGGHAFAAILEMNDAGNRVINYFPIDYNGKAFDHPPSLDRKNAFSVDSGVLVPITAQNAEAIKQRMTDLANDVEANALEDRKPENRFYFQPAEGAKQTAQEYAAFEKLGAQTTNCFSFAQDIMHHYGGFDLGSIIPLHRKTPTALDFSSQLNERISQNSSFFQPEGVLASAFKADQSQAEIFAFSGKHLGDHVLIPDVLNDLRWAEHESALHHLQYNSQPFPTAGPNQVIQAEQATVSALDNTDHTLDTGPSRWL